VLILVRHGRTLRNADGVLQGRADISLDDVGRGQAAALATALPTLARVVSSPLIRAVQTAEALGPKVEIDERFIELDYGSFDGLPLTEVPVSTWNRWRSDLDYAAPDGESLRQLGERVRPALAELATAALDQDIAVVSHVSPIKAALVWALDIDEAATWRSYLSPASITRIGWSRDAPVLISFNETLHLG
jgi:broad specificity phosphatase PhoE